MATTRRKTTAPITASREGPLGPSREWSKYNTSLCLVRQEVCGVPSNLLEAVVPLIAKTAATAVALHAQWSGSTVSVAGENMAGLPCFAVSTYPKRAVELSAAPTWELLFAFAIINLDLLLLPDHALGTWFDKHGSRHHFFNVVVAVADLQQALGLGHDHGQRFVHDLEHQEEIAIPRLIPVNHSSVVEGGND